MKSSNHIRIRDLVTGKYIAKSKLRNRKTNIKFEIVNTITGKRIGGVSIELGRKLIKRELAKREAIRKSRRKFKRQYKGKRVLRLNNPKKIINFLEKMQPGIYSVKIFEKEKDKPYSGNIVFSSPQGAYVGIHFLMGLAPDWQKSYHKLAGRDGNIEGLEVKRILTFKKARLDRKKLKTKRIKIDWRPEKEESKHKYRIVKE